VRKPHFSHKEMKRIKFLFFARCKEETGVSEYEMKAEGVDY